MKELTMILICIALFLSFGAGACSKGNGNSGASQTQNSASDKDDPVVIVEPVYNVNVTIAVRDYGSIDIGEAEIIENSYLSVYGLTAKYDTTARYGSAVAFACVKPEAANEGDLSDESSSNASSAGAEANENADYQTYLVTCLNIIDGADEYSVSASDGTVYPAEFIGADPNTDIAVLMVYAKLPVAEFVSDSAAVRLGDGMFAVGFPVNAGAGVVKRTALGAKEHAVNIGSNVYNMMILSDELSGGYAGGAAYVLNGGAVCGIIVAPDGVTTEGYSFMIPANTVVSVIRDLVGTYGENTYGYIPGNFYLGATYEDSRMTSSKYVYISSIDPSGSLYLGGLRAGDRIYTVEYLPLGGEGRAADVTSKAELEEFIRSLTELKIGDKLSFKCVRERLSFTREITVVQYVYGAESIS